MTPDKPANKSLVENFRDEFAVVWKGIPFKGLFFTSLALWLGLFHFLGNSTLGYVNTTSLFGWLNYGYSQGDDDQFALLMLLVVAGLFWWKRRELLTVPMRHWLPGLAIFGFALLLHVAGYMVQQTRISFVAFFIGIYGLMGLTWGPQWLRATFFPFCLFAFCVPLGNWTDFITFPMRMLVTKLSVGFSNVVLGIDVIRDGSRIFDAHGSYQYDVAPACSGIRSLISLLALTVVYGFLSFRKTWKRGLIIGMAFPLAIVGNTVRIIAVIIAGEAFGHEAGAWIEQKLGFVTFAVALTAIFLLGYLLREGKGPASPAQVEVASRIEPISQHAE